jgi:hypothetical protein
MERAYAYSYLLESIKGPDYVDCDGDGVAGDGDIGGWVRFAYGKHLQSYHYRTPYSGVAPVGVSRDLKIDDGKYNNYGQASWGTKEVYFLTEIVTPTHVAKFTLSDRDDGREAKIEDVKESLLSIDTEKGMLALKSYGYVLEPLDTCIISYNYSAAPDPNNPWNCMQMFSETYTTIVDDEIKPGNDRNNGNILDQTYYLRNIAGGGFAGPTENCNPDIAINEIMIKRCVKNGRLQKIDRIDLFKRVTAEINEVSPQKSVLFGYETDVSKMLCPGIPNGFLENNGKLTLRNVTFRLNDAIAMPPYSFTYYKEGGEAPYNREHWDRWGYYKSDGGLIPVKIARRNIASWKDMLEYLDNLPPEGSPGRDANIGMVLRDTLKILLSKKDLRILLNTPVEELLDPESGKFTPLHKDAIAEAIDRLRRDKNLFYRYRWGYGFLKQVDAKTSDLNDYIYPNCNEYYTSLTSGDNPIMETDGLVRGDLLQWEVNRVVAFNMALLSEMCFLKDENDPTMPVTENDRAVMKHLEINRMDHEPNKDDVIAWSLKNVTTPSGAKLNVEYESDDFTYVGRTRAVVPNEKQKFDADGTISEEDMTDMSFYKFIGMEKDLISKNNVLRVNFSENSTDVLEQDGPLALTI